MIEREAGAYRFAGFILSRTRRQLLKDGQVLPLIPRYFDLLVLLVDRRQQAVSRREIFDRVWSDVIVSDGALSQAVRTLRRTLGDDPREPIFIRTVSRHGYSSCSRMLPRRSRSKTPSLAIGCHERNRKIALGQTRWMPSSSVS